MTQLETRPGSQSAGGRRAALVTGCGKSDGIGAEIARTLARSGHALVVSDVTTLGVEDAHTRPRAAADRGLEGLVDTIVGAGGEACAMLADITLEEDARGLVARALETYGRLDVLVNNAAAPHGAEYGDPEEVSVAAWDHVMAVNVRGPFLLARAALRPMREQGWGRIVNISSIAGKMGIARQAAYTASKHALIGLTRSLALDAGPQSITVNAICAGQLLTARSYDSAVRSGNPDLESEMARRAASIPVRRVGLPADIAGLVDYLASDAAGFVNGQAISVDGGATTF